MAIVLAKYAPEGVDIFHAIKMLLIHNLVEIDAGDTNSQFAIRNDALYDTLLLASFPEGVRGLALSVRVSVSSKSYAVGVLLRPSKLRGACRRQASRSLSSSLKEKRRLYAALTQFNNLDAARL
ncbi:MAG: HD domain-containing protein [Nostoc sp.]|uniref:HD domain-containing protein n=1 Tax=Nostoc sp. TaxID=1180 RepID=UPI002FF30CFE